MRPKDIIAIMLIALALGAALGALVGAGWAIWGDIKGEWTLAVGIGLVAGVALGLPVAAWRLAETLRAKRWQRIAALVPALFILSFCAPAYRGPVLFLQLCAVLLPALAAKRAWSALLLGLVGGFAFFGLWAWLYVHRLAPIPASDDIFVFFPYAIVLVSLDAAHSRALWPRRRGEARPAAEGSG